MIDRFGRHIHYLRLSVTDLCNLRCRYCMPAEGVDKKRHDELLTEEELLLVVEAAAELGVDKLRITGGEPLTKPNILSICRRAAAVPGMRELCLTTNGSLLPALAGALREAGVQRVNISLDTLDAAKYAELTRGGVLSDALRGIEAALNAGFERVKLNAVLMKGFNDDEIEALAALTLRWPVDVRFIELMPMSDEAVYQAMLSSEAVLARLPEARPVGAKEGVARLYRLPGAQGSIGLISPVSADFCASCDRLRVTADGRVKPCLHGAEELSLKGLDRAGMREQLLRAVERKPARHGLLSIDCPSKAGRQMRGIGG